MQTDCIGKALVRKLDNVLNIYLSETTVLGLFFFKICYLKLISEKYCLQLKLIEKRINKTFL